MALPLRINVLLGCGILLITIFIIQISDLVLNEVCKKFVLCNSDEASTQTVDKEQDEIDEKDQYQFIQDPVELMKSRVENFNKFQKFPECARSRRLEHPGIGQGPRVQYIHNPKAGGTSIQLGMWEWVKSAPSASFMKYDSNSVKGSSSKCPGLAFPSTVLAGHRGFGYCRAIENSPRGLFTFTAFRDSVARMVSWFDYNLYTINDQRALAVFGKSGPGLNSLVKRYNSTEKHEFGERLLRYAGQQQARFLCGYEVSSESTIRSDQASPFELT
jgi:hypothetical protein